MTENIDQIKIEEEKNKLKEIEYASAGYNAWFNSALEHDKSLLTLSAGGIGVLASLMASVGIKSAESLVLYIAAILFFFISLVVVLFIFARNKKHIENVLRGNDNSDIWLIFADRIALFSFGIGALLTVIIGISSAISSYSIKDQKMAKENQKQQTTQTTFVIDSANGMASLKESFSGAAQLKPQQPAASTQTTQQPDTQATKQK